MYHRPPSDASRRSADGSLDTGRACATSASRVAEPTNGDVGTSALERNATSPYDAIARVYDPWSASVTEDVEFYVEEARASGGPVVELAVRHRPDRGADRAGRASDVIGVDASAGMLEVARELRERGGRRGLLDLRSATCASRPSRSASRSS